MSLSNSTVIPLSLTNVDVFTFGESTLFGYDSSNGCLIVLSLIELNDLNDQSIIRLRLSKCPTVRIKKLILNPDETILALISDRQAFLVYLPQSTNSSLKDSCHYPLNEIPLVIDDSSLINNRLIDFLWLSPVDLLIVNSIPSSSECHLYRIGSSKSHGIAFVQTFPVGSSKSKERSGTTPKKISPYEQLDIVKLDFGKRKEDNWTLILLFAMKSDGDIFFMTIDENQLRNNVKTLSCSFVGPMRIHPSRDDNYGADHSHSRLLCLSSSKFPIIIFTRDQYQMNECIFLNPKVDESYLYNIDSINLPKSEKNLTIKSMLIDKLNENIYYISDSLSNIYSIEIRWINQIGEKQLEKTIVRHLIQTNDFIYQFGLVQTKSKGQCLTIIRKTNNSREKELIVIRPWSSSLNSSVVQSHPSRGTIQTSSSSEFLDCIERILHHDQSLPQLTLSSSSTNLSQSDLEKNLLQYLEIFSREYLSKHEKLRIELENRQRYLNYFQQTQVLAQIELQIKLEQIQQTFDSLHQRYEQECVRRKELSCEVDDLLSIIEQRIPPMSDAEMLMHQQLTNYQIQINSLGKKISLLKEFISRGEHRNANEQRISEAFMAKFQEYFQCFEKNMDQMKQKFKVFSRTTKPIPFFPNLFNKEQTFLYLQIFTSEIFAPILNVNFDM